MTQPFWNRGYDIVEGLLDASHIEMVSRSMELSLRDGRMKTSDPKFIDAGEDEYSPVFGEMLLRHCRPAVAGAVGRELLDSYAYWRVYRHGTSMKRHRDRAGSEIAVSISIAADPTPTAWPLMIEDLHGETRAIVLKPGTGIVYQGHKVHHWRDALPGQSQMQLMLFYVLKDGNFSKHEFDQRPGNPLGFDR